MHKNNMMNQRTAGNILRRNAPKGEFPAFINQQEASWLKGMGGSGKKTKSGLRSYQTRPDSELGEKVGRDVTGTKTFVARDRTDDPNTQGIFEDAKRGFRSLTQTKDSQGNYRWNKGGDEVVQDTSSAGIPNYQTGTMGTGKGRLPSLPNIQNPLSGGMAVRNNTSTSVSELDKPTHDFRKKVYDKAGDVMDQEYEAYDGERFAGASQDTLDAQEAVRGMQGVGQGAYDSAGQTAENIQGATIDPISGQTMLTGTGIDEYSNPYKDQVIGGLQQQAMKNMQMGRNQLGAQAQMAGAGMGSRSAIEKGVMAGEVMSNLNRQIGDLEYKGFQDASGMKQADLDRKLQQDRYNQVAQGEQGRLQLAGADARLRATDAGRQAGYQDAQMLSKVGADLEARDQRDKDFAYDEYLEGRDWDKNNAMFASNVLSGAPSGTTTTQNNPQYRNQQTDRFGRILSGAGAGWLASGSPYGAIAGGALGAFS